MTFCWILQFIGMKKICTRQSNCFMRATCLSPCLKDVAFCILELFTMHL
uniref:Uncharacterized protein n=1 Tax=Rhizophora mucronata TaxID=61149 RepID=A0A2P2NHG7_RHIMU